MDHLLSKYSSTMGSNATRRNHRRNPFQRMFDRVQLEYYRYEVTFGIYVMTPNEKMVANAFVLITLALFFWALLYLPSLLYKKAGGLVWLLTGHNGQELGTTLSNLDQYEESILSAAGSAFA